jgi:hypothetical protein
MNIKDYQVVTDLISSQLEDKVRALLKTGWEPLGGISITAAHIPDSPIPGKSEDRIVYAQALIKS